MPAPANTDSFANMHIMLLVLIIFILSIILFFSQSTAIALDEDHDDSQVSRKRAKRSLWHRSCQSRPELPEERHTLSQDEGQLEGGQPQGSGHDTNDHFIGEINLLKYSNAKKTKQLEKLQLELSASISRNTELQRQYETLSKHVEGAQPLLSTADMFSDSEIIQMLQKLNAELQHTSTLVADHALSAFKLGAKVPNPEQRLLADKASESVGSTLVEYLQTVAHDDSEASLYLQIAFQAHLVHHLYWIASSWCPDEACNTFINEIYHRLRNKETQLISGRWRSLTRAYAPPTGTSEYTYAKPTISGLSDILLAAGCTAPRSDIISELERMFEKKILSYISLARQLNQMIGGVISGDFEVVTVRHGEAFDKEMMEEDTDGTRDNLVQSTGAAETVMCASELGLSKRVQTEAGGKETRVVVKTKVILESFIES